MPTARMFAYAASAIGRLKCWGAAVPSVRRVTVVSVIDAAASAILLPRRKLVSMPAKVCSRKKYHTDASGGTTFG